MIYSKIVGNAVAFDLRPQSLKHFAKKAREGMPAFLEEKSIRGYQTLGESKCAGTEESTKLFGYTAEQVSKYGNLLIISLLAAGGVVCWRKGLIG